LMFALRNIIKIFASGDRPGPVGNGGAVVKLIMVIL
jgi:hypothetical protein